MGKRNIPNSLEDAINGTVRDYADGVPALAEAIGYSPSMLYRATNPGDACARLDALRLPALLRETRDDRIVRYLAHLRGYLLVKVPRVRRGKEDEVAELQRHQADAIQALVAFFSGERDQASTLDALRRELEACAGMAKAVEAYHRPGLFDDDDQEQP